MMVVVASLLHRHFHAGSFRCVGLAHRLSGGSGIVIDSGPVVFTVAGQGVNTPVDLTGGTLTTLNIDPSQFRIDYAGTGGIKLNGGTWSMSRCAATDGWVVGTD